MPERDCEISESAEELLNMMKNGKKGRFRDRLRLLRLLKSGAAETVTRAAGLCGAARLAAAERFHRYSTGGIRELPQLYTKQKGQSFPKMSLRYFCRPTAPSRILLKDFGSISKGIQKEKFFHISGK